MMKGRRIWAWGIAVFALGLGVSLGYAAPEFLKGQAVIRPTMEGSTLNGVVDFVEMHEGLSIEAKLENVPGPGKHGFHVHETGSCDDEGKAAGGHYNPAGAAHGYLPDDGEQKAHSGDMGNITIDENGQGTLQVFLPNVGLTHGEHTVADRAVILHEKEDDFGQPTGNAGGRIGCGIIQVTGGN